MALQKTDIMMRLVSLARTRVFPIGLCLVMAFVADLCIAAKRTTFSVATYNVRVDAKEDGPNRSWEKRLPRIVEVVRHGRFDLVGFQEVTPKMLEALERAFPEYKVIGYADKNGPVPIAFRQELFDVVDFGRFSLSENPFDFSVVSWGSSGVRICQWVLFRVRETGRRLRVFNVHPDWLSCKARAKGMEMLLARVNAATLFGEQAILLGDMNDMEGVRAPKEKYDSDYPMGGSISRAKSVLRDSFDITRTPHEGPYMTASWYKPKASERLDYIFVTGGLAVEAHRTHGERPGGEFPSDHDAVSAVISY